MRWPAREPGLSRGGLVEERAGLRAPVERHDTPQPGWYTAAGISDRATQGLLKGFDRALVLAQVEVRDAQAVERKRLARVGGGPGLRQLERLVPGLRGVAVIPPRDEEPLALADPVAQRRTRVRDNSGASADWPVLA